MEGLGQIPLPPANVEELSLVAKPLREFVGVDTLTESVLPSRPRSTMPPALFCIFHETYLSTLSETFSKASHEGDYDLALDTGVTLLAAYIIIYPPNYPQIGVCEDCGFD